MVMFLNWFRRTPKKYSKIVDEAYSKGNIINELQELAGLLRKKEKIESRLNRKWDYDEKSIAKLLEILTEILNKVKRYFKSYKLIKRISEKYADNKKHSSHAIVIQVEKFQQETGITFEQLINYYNRLIKKLSEKDLPDYFKRKELVSLTQLKRIYPKASKARDSMTYYPWFVSILMFLLAAYAIKGGLVELRINQINRLLFDTQTHVEQSFYDETGIRIYSSSDKDAKLIHYVLNNIYQDMSFLMKHGINRIIFIAYSNPDLGGGKSLIFDEILLNESLSDYQKIYHFFHELGHAIHHNLENKRQFEAEIKTFIKEIDKVSKESMNNFLKKSGYGALSRLLFCDDETIANFYRARMDGIYDFYKKHNRLPNLGELMVHDGMTDEEKEVYIGLIKIFHKYGFFPERFAIE